MAVSGVFKSFGGDYETKVIVSLVGHLRPLDLIVEEFCSSL